MRKILAPRLSLQTLAWRQIGDSLRVENLSHAESKEPTKAESSGWLLWMRVLQCSVYIAGGRQQSTFGIFVSSEVSASQKFMAQK